MRLLALVPMALAALSLAGCGGGGSSTPVAQQAAAPAPTPTPTPSPTPTVSNTAQVLLDAGPTALGANNSAFNVPFVTITLCAPGSTTNCQTIDHVILDTGSVGLRVIQPALDASLLAALPTQSDPAGNAVGECYQYVNSYAFGSVRLADFTIAGEQVAQMPIQAIGDTGAFASVPSSCSSGGGTDIATVADFGANGIIGVGTTATDCGALCQAASANAAAIYYDCPASGCGGVIARAPATSAPFQQLPNPVAAFAADNNGTVITLPAIPPAGVTSATGTVVFGIATQSDNAVTAANLLPLTTSSSRLGPGNFTATYNGTQLTQSFLDTGSNAYYFIDAAIPACTDPIWVDYYCPAQAQTIAAQLTGTTGVGTGTSFLLVNPPATVSGSANVAPGVGINPTLVKPPLPFANSFDFGLPFFFGRTVYTAIEGRPAGPINGPYVAF